ncbi:MAG: carboxymuconolactone decarboxylase family protein [Rhizobiaceae bacterium]|nr:carboxymuconolactone decarboxylase family protein [Rhizobiaceae bacterium]
MKSPMSREELRTKGASLRAALGVAGTQADDEQAPGLAALLDEIAFARVWSRPGLQARERMLATLSALTSKRYLDALEDYTRAALAMSLKPRAIQEVMIHCAMYAGLPSAFESLERVNSILVAEGLPLPVADWTPKELVDLFDAGRDMMMTLHSERAALGYASAESAAFGLYQSAIDLLYGDIWNRPGLTTRERMVCSIASFTALRLESQQRKFFRSALNVGLSRDEVVEIIGQTAPYSGFAPAFGALAIADEVLAD